MELTKTKLNQLMNQAEGMLKELGYKIPNYKYTLDNRSTKRAGCCNYGKKEIKVATKVMKYHSEEKAFDTCVHELIHAVAVESFGCTGHTGKWKQIANEVNRNYGMNLKRCYTMTQEQIEATQKKDKYVIHCESCDFKQGRKKASNVTKYPFNYRCPRCGGHLKVEKKY